MPSLYRSDTKIKPSSFIAHYENRAAFGTVIEPCPPWFLMVFGNSHANSASQVDVHIRNATGHVGAGPAAFGMDPRCPPSAYSALPPRPARSTLPDPPCQIRTGVVGAVPPVAQVTALPQEIGLDRLPHLSL